MTPLLTNVLSGGITPATALLGTCWGCVVIPELTAYLVANGANPANIGAGAGGNPIPGPIYREISGWNYRIETGAGITAGAVSLYELNLDGNWHILGAGLTFAVTFSYTGGIGLGGSFANSGSLVSNTAGPFYGLMIRFTTALTGGNVNYLETKAVCNYVDAKTDRLPMPIKL